MALLCDYFAAASDDEAGKTIDWLGGPSRPPEDASRPSYQVVSLNGVEPTVMMGSLEGLLTGRSLIDEIIKDPARNPIAVRDGGERLVVPLGPRMDEALATASDDRLTELSVPWSQTEEFWGQGDPEILADALVELAALARQAQEQGQHLYCWLSV